MEENTATHLVSQVLTANESSGRIAAFGRNGTSNWDLQGADIRVAFLKICIWDFACEYMGTQMAVFAHTCPS